MKMDFSSELNLKNKEYLRAVEAYLWQICSILGSVSTAA